MKDSEKVTLSKPVFAYLKPTIFFMRLFGLAPVSYKSMKKHYVIEKSRKYTIYSFTMAIIFGGVTILGVVNDANAENSIRMKVKNQIFLVVLDIGIVVWSVLFGVFMGPCKVKELLNILLYFNQMNIEMIESNEHMKEEKRVAYSIALTVYTIFVSVITLDIFVWLERCNSNNEKFLYIKDYSFFYVLYLVVMSQELSFCNFTYYIKKRIMALNRSLSKEINRKPEAFVAKHRSRKSSDFNSSYLSTGAAGDVLENYVLKNTSYLPNNELDAEKVLSLMRVHSLIFAAVTSINECFGYPLLFIMTSCLFHLVITPFFLIVGSERIPLFILLQIIWILVHFGRLLIIVEPTHRCIQECEKTNPLIIHLLSKVEDKEVRQKLELLAIQAHLCVIQFTSCGIVTIRRSMLASIASAVTTYLVIMIQLSK